MYPSAKEGCIHQARCRAKQIFCSPRRGRVPYGQWSVSTTAGDHVGFSHAIRVNHCPTFEGDLCFSVHINIFN